MSIRSITMLVLAMLLCGSTAFAQESFTHSRPIIGLGQSISGDYLVSGDQGGTIILWNEQLQALDTFLTGDLFIFNIDLDVKEADSSVTVLSNTINFSDQITAGYLNSSGLQFWKLKEGVKTHNTNLLNREWKIITTDDGKDVLSIMNSYDDSSGSIIFKESYLTKYDLIDSQLNLAIEPLVDQSKISAFEIHRESGRVAIGFHDGRIEIRGIDSLQLLQTIEEADGPITKMKFLPDGSRIAFLSVTKLNKSSFNEYYLTIYNLRNTHGQRLIIEKNESIKTFDISLDGSHIAMVSENNKLVIWEANNLTEVKRYSVSGLDEMAKVNDILLLDEGRIIVAGRSYNMEAKMIKLNWSSGEYLVFGSKPAVQVVPQVNPLFTLGIEEYEGEFSYGGVSVSEEQVITYDSEKVNVFNFKGELVKSYLGLNLPKENTGFLSDINIVQASVISKNSSVLVVGLENTNYSKSGERKWKVYAIDSETDSLLGEWEFKAKGWLFPQLNVAPNGELITLAHGRDDNPQIIIINPKKNTTKKISGIKGSEIEIVFSEKGNNLALIPAGWYPESNELRIYQTEPFKEHITIPGPEYGFSRTVIIEDQDLILATSDIEKRLIGYSLQGGNVKWNTDIHEEYESTISMSIHPTTGMIYLLLKGSGSQEFYLKGIDPKTGNELNSQRLSSEEVRAGMFNLKGDYFLMNILENRLGVTEIPVNTDLQKSIQLQIVPQLGHYGMISYVVYSNDGRYAGTVGSDGRGKIIDLKTGKELINIPDVDCCPAFSNDASVFFYGKLGTVYGIDLETGSTIYQEDELYVDAFSLSLINSISTAPNRVMAYSDGSTFKVINTKSGEIVFKKSSEEVIRGLISPKGDVVAYTIGDKKLRLHDLVSNKEIYQKNLVQSYDLHSFIGRKILLTGLGSVGVFNLNDGSFKTSDIVAETFATDSFTNKIFAMSMGSFKAYDLNLNLIDDYCEGYSAIEGCPMAEFSNSIAVSPDGRRLMISQYGLLEEWDIRSQTLVREIKGKVTRNLGVQFLPDQNSLIIAAFSKAPVLVNLSSGKVSQKTLEEVADGFNSKRPTQNSIAAVGTSDYAYVSNNGYMNPDKLTYSNGKEPYTPSIGVVSNRQGYLVNSGKGRLSIFDKDLELISSIKGNLPLALNDTGYLAFREGNGVSILDVPTGILVRKIKPRNGNVGNSISLANREGFIAFTNSNDRAEVYNLKDGASISMVTPNQLVNQVYFTDEGKLITAGLYDFTLNIYDPLIEQKVASIPGHTDIITQLSESERHLYSASRDGTVKIWNKENWELIATVVVYDSADIIITTPDKYYLSTREGIRGIGFRLGKETFPFEQFDLQFNRPDIVLSRLGFADNEIIESYYKAYLKRLSKLGFDQSMFDDELMLPNIEVSGVKPGTTLNDKLINVLIAASDSSSWLDRLNIWVNDVPIFGMAGFLFDDSIKTYLNNIDIPLSEGRNKIQVSCHNKKGVESLRETFQITYLPEELTKPNLYIVTLSVSDYKDSNYSLTYAKKDGKEMAKLLGANIDYYENIYYDTLFDENVTLENFASIKPLLMNSKVDDQVVVFASGHGLLDDNYDFYFGSYDLDFKDPAARGISYDAIEGLLDGIPARKKLLLIDACFSGEVDKEGLVAKVGNTDSTLVSGWNNKGVTGETSNSGLGLSNSFELMQELFANLSRGSGAVVISAAAGDSYALESDQWQNGVFTYCIKSALGYGGTELRADLNNDGQVTVTELKDYVSSEVEKLTNGRQKPTSRRENLEFDFVIKRN